MTKSTRLLMLAALFACAATSTAWAGYAWFWTTPLRLPGHAMDTTDVNYYLTNKNGSHAVAMTEYDYQADRKVQTCIVAERPVADWLPAGNVRAYVFTDAGPDWRHWPIPNSDWPSIPEFPQANTFQAINCNVSSNSVNRVVAWGNPHPDTTLLPDGRTTAGDLTDLSFVFWDNPSKLNLNIDSLRDSAVAVALFRSPNGSSLDSGSVVYSIWNSWPHDEHTHDLTAKYTTNGGKNWLGNSYEDGILIQRAELDTWFINLSLATDDVYGATVYLAYECIDANGAHHIMLRKSTDHGRSWSGDPTNLGPGFEPCVAAVGHNVIVCWKNSVGRIAYKYSSNSGGLWTSTTELPFDDYDGWTYDRPNVASLPFPDAAGPGFLVVTRLHLPYDDTRMVWTTRGLFLNFDASNVYCRRLMPLCVPFSFGEDVPLNPSIAALALSEGNQPECPIACCAYSWSDYDIVEPHHQHVGLRRTIRENHAYWASRPAEPSNSANTARLLALDAASTKHYASATWPYWASGQVIGGHPVYDIGGTGRMPTFALDADGGRWVGFVEQDTLWVHAVDGEPKMVFAGSSSAVPGQPSITCYPNQANGMTYGAVVFPVYDTAGEASKVLFARVCTSEVTFDTIESVQNLGDSLPCISVYKTDTLVVTYQHGDSVLSRLLADYGPGVSTPPPAWSSPSLVTADGYHSMSVFDVGGSVLNCVWTVKDGSNFAISRATYDPTSMFAGWTSQSDPSGTAAVEKAHGVYAGVGCSVWEQMASGKWTIKGKVRGAEKTLVANDTDAYHPHAVADSVACNPSTDRINLRLLYTAGVTFEVDSGVFDTGETRFAQFEYDVSHAGANATASNTGTKLLRKAAGDSLYCLYSDADGAVWYAWSAAGDSWKRDMLVADRDWPAIAEDSSGQRWAVLHGTSGETSAGLIEAYYLHNSTWELLQTIFTNASQKSVGPAALAGASSTSMSIAYAAFKVEGENETYTIRVVKFDGSSLDTCTIASGSSLGDPSITVEPVSQDSDRIHVTWSDNGEVKYRACMDGRDAAMAGNWTSTVNLSSTQNPSVHPFIAANRDWVVVAWAEGDTADIYSRKHSTDSAYNNWQSSVNLSNTSKVSDYPTIAMGDTVIVAWEEHRNTTSDYDILACINFDDTLNIADNATLSSYPHVLFQNKASGDTAIPYLLTVWSEAPAANVYEVEFNKLNLKQAQGGGQQSASKTPLPTKPSLSACRPNPFQNRTTISYQLPQAGNVSLCIYDVTGRTVKTLQAGFQKPGSYSAVWDGRDNKGRSVAKGVYFYRLDTPGFRAIRKAVVTR